MKERQRPPGFIAILALGLTLVLSGAFAQTAGAASEDVAMFYDDLSQHGQWVDYESYGPVWQPNNVSEDWRPYTDGRWTPTNDGYVFESQEPWGWATYHYGNWMPAPGYGWVWVPGRTWYPSTVDWRTSPEDAPVDASYIGWAPTPPPNYVPQQGYAPASYYQGAPGMDALSSPLWTFVRAASFLLGFGQPYAPSYSYGGCGCLAPPTYVPTFFPQTVYVPSYYTPTYYPQSYYGGGFAGSYSYGPPVRYVSRVTNINTTIINRTIINNSNNITRIHNIRPPRDVLTRNPHLRGITPPALVQGRRLPQSRPVRNIQQAQASMNRPNIIRAPKNVPQLQAQIPKARPLAGQAGRTGASLPSRATMQLTPQQQGQIKNLPPRQQIPQASPAGRPGGPARPGAVQPGFQGKPGQAPPSGKPGLAQPEARPGAAQPGAFQPGGPGKPSAQPPSGQKPAPSGPGSVRPGAQPGRPGQVQPGAPGKSAAPLPPGSRGVSPQERQRLEGEHQKLQRRGQPAVTGRPQTPVQPPRGQFKPADPTQPQRPQPQVQPRPQPQPQRQPQIQPRPQPQPRPQVQPRPQPRPQPQVQPRPQPQVQPRQQFQPRPQPQVQPRPQPQPRPQVQPRPQPQPQPQAQPRRQPQPQPQGQPQSQPQPPQGGPRGSF